VPAAAAAVGQLGAGVPWTVALLTKALADPVHDVRKQAVVALEKMGPDAAPATKAIARLLHGKEIYLRVFAADALTAIGPGARAALPDLKALAARGWKDLENSPEYEAKQLPDAVARAIESIEVKPPKKGTRKR
jgi:HEAT repeat protein